jgi:hypothetical protein
MNTISELIERSNMFEEDIRVTKIKMNTLVNVNNIKINTPTVFTNTQDNFFMDTENWILEHKWKNKWSDLTGLKRLNNSEWIKLVYEHMDLPEINFELYKEWVTQGNGDEWFL